MSVLYTTVYISVCVCVYVRAFYNTNIRKYHYLLHRTTKQFYKSTYVIYKHILTYPKYKKISHFVITLAL